MTTFAEWLQQVRQERDSSSETATQQQQDSDSANWEATAEQLQKLIAGELEVSDTVAPERVLVATMYGMPEGYYAVAKLEDGEFWFGLPVSANAPNDYQLLAMVHCPNNHVLGKEYPVGEDTWDRVVGRVEDAQALYADTTKCPQCQAARTSAREYRPKLSTTYQAQAR